MGNCRSWRCIGRATTTGHGPRARLDEGETLPACAIREVAEETGKQVVLGQPLPTLRYPTGGKTKVVKYWAAQVASAGAAAAVAARPPVKSASKNEIDKVLWLGVNEARERITFPEDLRPLEVLVDAWENDRLLTRAFVLVRHARAKRRKAWKGPDARRPITKRGTLRAHELVSLFAAFGARRIDSSPARRCVATVEPYAAASGIEIKTHESLTEPGHAEAPLATAKTFVGLLGKSGSRVVCAHRPTLPTIIEMMRAATRPYTRGALPRKNPYLPAGGVLVAHVVDTESGPRVTAIETHLLHVHP
ncbi:histidine phosphatase family protein [Demequina litorisediminis]|uniref:histidine phosphatase family protein n=1 Tax=Demequina litorisediminis TaxID=1849022 RepID=UPI0024E0DDB2|nr:histidine phosphatase family protein [Demequina litorisediminis]